MFNGVPSPNAHVHAVGERCPPVLVREGALRVGKLSQSFQGFREPLPEERGYDVIGLALTRPAPWFSCATL